MHRASAPDPAPAETALALSRRFGDALRAGEGAPADHVIDDAHAAGLHAAEIQTLIIEPAMVRNGELWEQNLISVAAAGSTRR